MSTMTRLVLIVVCESSLLVAAENDIVRQTFQLLTESGDDAERESIVRKNLEKLPTALPDIVGSYLSHKREGGGKDGALFELRDVYFTLKTLKLNPTDEACRRIDKEPNALIRSRLLELMGVVPEKRSFEFLVEFLDDKHEADDRVVPTTGSPKRVCDTAANVLGAVIGFRNSKPSKNDSARNEFIEKIREHIKNNPQVVAEKFPERPK